MEANLALYKVVVHLSSPFGTAWQADTIFGHLCWAVLFRKGETGLKEFLKPFLAGDPPFLLSDGFPGDLLPRPLSYSIREAEEKESFRNARQLRKISYLPPDLFVQAISGKRPTTTEAPATHKNAGHLAKVESRVNYKNQISRLTSTTGEGGQLYGFVEYWTKQITVYVKLRHGRLHEVEELFRELATSGYGKRKAVGYGAISRMEFSEWHLPDTVQNANGFVSFSHFTPAETDPVNGFWRINVKYGKLGETLASSANPFKRPIVMLVPGSVFFDCLPKEFYGRMLKGISTHPDVVHYAYCLPVPIVLSRRTET